MGLSQEHLKIVLTRLVFQNGYFTCPATITGLLDVPSLWLADVLLLYPGTINCVGILEYMWKFSLTSRCVNNMLTNILASVFVFTFGLSVSVFL